MKPRSSHRLLVKAFGILIAAALCFPIPALSDEPSAKVITDISSWRHPVKKVFTTNKTTLEKVALYCDNKYPVFYVDLPYDPQTSAAKAFFNKLYMEILEANGHWNYALQSERDGIRIEINWNKKNKTLNEDIVPLENVPAPKCPS